MPAAAADKNAEAAEELVDYEEEEVAEAEAAKGKVRDDLAVTSAGGVLENSMTMHIFDYIFMKHARE